MKSVNSIFTRKIVSMLLVGMYLLFSVGILKSTHFCMGRKASETYFTTESKKCGCSAFMEENNDCCDDEQGLLKIDNEQKTISIFSLSVPQWMVIEKIYTEQLVAKAEPVNLSFTDRQLPPPDRPLFQLYCSLVFYDDDLIA
jgi:hypothetical protein